MATISAFKCGFSDCDKQYRSERLLNRHVMTHTIIKSEPESSEEDEEVNSIIKTEVSDEEFDCDASDDEFDCEDQSEKDNIKRSSGQSVKNRSEKASIKCDFNDCKQLFGSEHKLYLHIREIHIKCEKPFICDQIDCESRFKKLHDLRAHQRWHSEVAQEQDIICEFIGCGKTFRTRAQMRAHMRHTHTSIDKSISCDEPGCQFTTSTYCRLKDHKLKHSDYRAFECKFDGCLKASKTRRDLKKHVLRVHMNQKRMTNHLKSETQLICEWKDCQYKTHYNYVFRLHRFAHIKDQLALSCAHPDGPDQHSDQPMTCQWPGCQFSTQSKQTLYNHMNSGHKTNSNNEFVCDWPGCEFKTHSNSSFSRHKDVHKTVLAFPCDWPGCEKAFKSKKLLGQHSRVHGFAKRYDCEWPGCSYSSCDKSNVNQHMKRKHLKLFSKK